MTRSIPIFDSLVHPSLDGSWPPGKRPVDNDFASVAADLAASGVRWAWAVSMGTKGPYDPDLYPAACVGHAVRFLPVAYLDLAGFSSDQALAGWIAATASCGFRGIKLHPRLGGYDFTHPRLAFAINEAAAQGLLPFLCSYFYSADPRCIGLNIETLRHLLSKTAGSRMVLLHGGTVKLLEVSEITRSFRNVLLDLSFTICEYEGSSVDLDLAYVLDRCRDRVCIGSDSPDFPQRGCAGGSRN